MPTFLTIWRRSICAVSGAIAGGFVGLVFGLAQAGMPGVLPFADVLRAAIVLGLVAWLILLVIVGLWVHYGAGAIAAPALVTALLTSLLTVYLANQLQQPALAVWIGLLIGTLIGWMLCRLCREPKYDA